jgi:hypothetical protein
MKDEEELVPVLKTTDPALLPVMRSMLEAAGVPVVVQGEAGVGLFPLGAAGERVTGRMTGRMTGATLLVPRSREEEALALLETPGITEEHFDEVTGSDNAMRVGYTMFRGTFATWDELFAKAAAFATELGETRLINISHSVSGADGVVTVWYWIFDESDE